MDGGATNPPDPAAEGQRAALDRVRSDLAELGTDAQSAPEVPPEVTTRISAALRAASVPTHAARGTTTRWRPVVAVVGVAAAVAAACVGTLMLMRPSPTPARNAAPTVSSITVAGPAADFPLPEPELTGLLSQPPDLGPLADPARRASCLAGLGYSTSDPILGARPFDAAGQPGVVVLLPGNGPGRINVVLVRPSCSSVDTGLLADTTLNRSMTNP